MANRVVHLKDLEDGEAPPVTAEMATFASAPDRELGSGEAIGIEPDLTQTIGIGENGGLAVGANAPHEPLPDHRLNRRRDEERIHAEIVEAGDRRGRIVGMEGREHQVSGQRRLDRHGGRFAVADLTN